VSSEPSDLFRQAVGVEVVDESRARGDTSLGSVDRGGLFGGQMVAQSLSACAHTVPPGSVPDSIHVNMLGASQAGLPVDFQIERVRDGRAMQHREVRGFQDGRLILQALVVSSMPSAGLDWQEHSIPPDIGPPDAESSSSSDWTVGLGWGAFEIVHPKGDDGTGGSQPLWMRTIGAVSDDPWWHGAAVAFWSDFGMNWAVQASYRSLGRAVSSTSVTHSLWLHRRTPLREWHLFDVHTQSLAGNQGFVRAAIFNADGQLVASVDQGVFIRRPPA
jgi:acyl-CoA thioesterase-2